MLTFLAGKEEIDTEQNVSRCQPTRYSLTAVKRMSMRNALVPGRRPRKFPAQKFNWKVLREKKLNDSD